MTEYQIDAWKKEIYNALAAISDIATQKLEWIGPAASGAKIISRLYDLEYNLFISYLIENEEGSRKMLSEMLRLDKMLEDYSRIKISGEKMLLDPDWHAIAYTAAQIVILWDATMEE